MAMKILRQVEELVAAKLPVEQVRQEAMKAGVKGLRLLVDGALSAVKAVEERLHVKTEQLHDTPLQQRITPQAERVLDGAQAVGKAVEEHLQAGAEQVHKASDKLKSVQAPLAQPMVEDSTLLQQQIHATAERVLDEARAVEERLHAARPARRPIQVTVEANARPTARAKGRKLAPTANVSAKRVTAPTGGFKAKRGQKHTHSH